MTGDFVLRRFPVPNWRLPAALAAVLATGMNVMVFEYGTIGQAYGLCLFLIVAAFRASMLTVERDSLLWPALAGVACRSRGCIFPADSARGAGAAALDGAPAPYGKALDQERCIFLVGALLPFRAAAPAVPSVAPRGAL